MLNLEEMKRIREAPDFLTDEGFQTLTKGYLVSNETPKQMYHRVAKSAASYYKDSSKWEEKFFNAMWNNWLCPASPVLSNMGTDRGMPISCFSIDISDSIDSIFMKNHELAVLTKAGGGVGANMSRLRARGLNIKGNGKSDGIIPWCRILDTTVSSVSQGSTRRGAAAVYLPMDHGDIEEFMNIRRPTGDVNRRCLNLNNGVCITDKWMQEMLSGDKDKRLLWQELLKNRVEGGEPYLFFTDNVNKQNPECYKDKGLKVETSNICCLGGETLVLTRKGKITISKLVGKEVEIWDGKKWVLNNTFEQRGEDKLIRVHIKDGWYVDCNANHRWFVFDSLEEKVNGTQSKIIFAKELMLGQYIETHNWIGSNKELLFEDDAEESGYSEIVKIEELPGIHPVYCPNLPSTGKFALANGLMTGNTEIFLHTDPEHTFVCCLSSLNLVKWSEWKDTDTVEVAVRFLDAVLQEYIVKSEGVPGLECSRRSAIKGRAIGIGVLGWHTLLQERMIPFDSFDAMQLNAEIFKTMRIRAEVETKLLAQELGEPEWCSGHNRRNTHLLACAPTVSNSTISGGYSAGIEPIAANFYSQKSAKGTFIRKNPTLQRLLESKEKNTLEIWKSINEKSGSVQHLDCLSKEEKEVFLTAREINQHAIIKQAAQRQKWIDQGQSINLFFASNSNPKYIHEVHIAAWEAGLKSLYYLRTDGVIRGDMASRTKEECTACEG